MTVTERQSSCGNDIQILGFILCINNGDIPSDLRCTVATICYRRYRESGAYYSGSNNSFQSCQAKGKVLLTEDQENHICGVCARILLPLEGSPSVTPPQPSLWNYSAQETFPLKSKDGGLRIAFTVSFIYQASLALLYLSDFSPRQLHQELLQCAVFSLVLVILCIVLWLCLLCCFLWHHSLTGLEYRHLDSLVVIFILWPSIRETSRTVIPNW